MSAPIYTPFFIHPNQKKRIPRKRNVTLQQEEGFAPVYDTRTRRPTSANGNGEWVPVRTSDVSRASPSILRNSEMRTIKRTVEEPLVHIPITRSKRSRETLEEEQQVVHKMGDNDSGPHDVAAEVEVNVEDVGEPDPADSSFHSMGGNGGENCANDGAALHLSQYAGKSTHHLHHHNQQQQRQKHPQQQQAQQPQASSVASSKQQMQQQFDPDTCTDLTELRHRLYAAYDRIEQLGRATLCINRLKHENNSMKAELHKCTYRISQLESIVLERNLRLKQLLSENVVMSARMKRIQSEFGIDAVKEIFNRDKD